MHPAFSVIFFTTASGAGYGLLALTGVLAPLRLIPADRGFALTLLALALGLITAGLLSSTAHLGHPERAWRAFSQWRTSWLSREGVLSLATYIPAGLFAIGWVLFGRLDGVFAIIGFATAVLALITVYCTAMIYASLKPIHAWHNAWVVPSYAALALMTGTLWLNALTHAWGAGTPGLGGLAAAGTALGFLAKEGYWRFIDTTLGPSTAESATGLGARGKVTLLDGPHTQANYLQREMGYAIARKHSAKLRRISRLLAFALPLLLTLLALLIDGTLAVPMTLLAAVLGMLGVLIERWLFFAEARHTVALYYGASTA
jgi:DMSO reductase anchor subunit